MGCTVVGKHARANRRNRSVKSDVVEHGNSGEKESIPADGESGYRSIGNETSSGGSQQSSRIRPSPNFEETSCGYCAEEQLEGVLLRNLEFFYNEAMAKLVSMGYDRDFALNILLKSGHCYGQSDVLSNIMQNSLNYLNDDGISNEGSSSFTDLRHMVEYSLAALVCFLQRVKTHLSKVDAMWCLLMSELNLTRACAMDFPVSPMSSSSIRMSPGTCKNHGGQGLKTGGTSELELPKRYNLTTSMKSLLKKNVSLFSSGFGANPKQSQVQSQSQSQVPPTSAASGLDSIAEVANELKKDEELQGSKSHDAIIANAVLNKFRELNMEDGTDCDLDHMDEVVLRLIRQITDLEKQVKDRKEWAQQKVIQAAKKLSQDLTELRMLRMQKEDSQRLIKGKQALVDDSTMRCLSDMENALRKASGEVDRANAAMRRIEIDNSEMRAEMQAAKLSASETIITLREVVKRKKRALKKALAWEKQKTTLMEEISVEKAKMIDMHTELVQLKAEQKKAEEQWKQEQKAKEIADTQAGKEKQLNEEMETNNNKKLEALHQKIDLNFQLKKDDVQRLEHEISRLQPPPPPPPAGSATKGSQRLTNQPKNPLSTTIRLLNKLDASLEKTWGLCSNTHRKCLICRKNQVSIVFLPCTHQVICSNCNDIQGKKVKPTCPSCRMVIERRIRVYGATS